MGNLNIGDIVARKSYGCDVLFKVVDIKQAEPGRIIILKGICLRIQADAPESDLLKQAESTINEHNARLRSVVIES
jgi:spore coat assemly protein